MMRQRTLATAYGGDNDVELGVLGYQVVGSGGNSDRRRSSRGGNGQQLGGANGGAASVTGGRWGDERCHRSGQWVTPKLESGKVAEALCGSHHGAGRALR
jgi:hypothetical protein